MKRFMPVGKPLVFTGVVQPQIYIRSFSLHRTQCLYSKLWYDLLDCDKVINNNNNNNNVIHIFPLNIWTGKRQFGHL